MPFAEEEILRLIERIGRLELVNTEIKQGHEALKKIISETNDEKINETNQTINESENNIIVEN